MTTTERAGTPRTTAPAGRGAVAAAVAPVLLAAAVLVVVWQDPGVAVLAVPGLAVASVVVAAVRSLPPTTRSAALAGVAVTAAALSAVPWILPGAVTGPLAAVLVSGGAVTATAAVVLLLAWRLPADGRLARPGVAARSVAALAAGGAVAALAPVATGSSCVRTAARTACVAVEDPVVENAVVAALVAGGVLLLPWTVRSRRADRRGS